MRLKQVSLKGPYEGTATSGTKLVNLTPSYINATFWSTGKNRDIILLRRFCTYLMTVFEDIILLFKRPGVPEKTEK